MRGVRRAPRRRIRATSRIPTGRSSRTSAATSRSRTRHSRLGRDRGDRRGGRVHRAADRGGRVRRRHRPLPGDHGKGKPCQRTPLPSASTARRTSTWKPDPPPRSRSQSPSRTIGPCPVDAEPRATPLEVTSAPRPSATGGARGASSQVACHSALGSGDDPCLRGRHHGLDRGPVARAVEGRTTSRSSRVSPGRRPARPSRVSPRRSSARCGGVGDRRDRRRRRLHRCGGREGERHGRARSGRLRRRGLERAHRRRLRRDRPARPRGRRRRRGWQLLAPGSTPLRARPPRWPATYPPGRSSTTRAPPSRTCPAAPRVSWRNAWARPASRPRTAARRPAGGPWRRGAPPSPARRSTPCGSRASSSRPRSSSRRRRAPDPPPRPRREPGAVHRGHPARDPLGAGPRRSHPGARRATGLTPRRRELLEVLDLRDADTPRRSAPGRSASARSSRSHASRPMRSPSARPAAGSSSGCGWRNPGSGASWSPSARPGPTRAVSPTRIAMRAEARRAAARGRRRRAESLLVTD